jgi:hypothetical protein
MHELKNFNSCILKSKFPNYNALNILMIKIWYN